MSPEQSAREARALAEIVQRINQSLELDRVFALIVRHAAELLHARGARLGLVEDGSMVIAATHGDPDDLAITAAEAFGSISASGAHPLWERRRELSDIGNVVAVPCLANGLVIGAISVFDVPERRFDTHDEELLLALANHAAIAIDNARLYRQSVRAMEHASILASSARSLAMHLTPDEIYADIERITNTSLDADGLTLYQAASTHGVVTTPVSSGPGCNVSVMALPKFWSVTGGAVMLAGTPLFLQSLDSIVDDSLRVHLVDAGIRSIAFVPLGVEGRLQGLLVLRYARSPCATRSSSSASSSAPSASPPSPRCSRRSPRPCRSPTSTPRAIARWRPSSTHRASCSCDTMCIATCSSPSTS